MVSKTFKIFIILFFVLVFSIIILFCFPIKQTDNLFQSARQIEINGAILNVEIAQTPLEQSTGLSNRDFLDASSGMLFVYGDKEIRNFWMKDMRFPLDVIWIANRVVVGVQENIPPKSEDGSVTRFQSSMPADAVLEVKAGWVSSNGVSIGDIIDTKSD